jgi:chromosome segregation ATPase
MQERFGRAYDLAIEPPSSFSLASRRRQLNQLETSSRRQYGSLLRLLTSDKRTLTQQFFETIVSQIRRTFDHANRDAEHWLRTLMAPLENQVREVQRQMRHRLENVRRIHDAADNLEGRIEELAQDRTLLNARLGGLAELTTALESSRRPPQRAPMQAAA